MSKTNARPASTTPSRDQSPPAASGYEGRALTRVTFALLFGYLVFVVALMVTRRSTISIEVFFVFAGMVAIILGRGISFVRDWLPFAAIFVAWQTMRGLADDIGARVQSDSIIAVERAANFGTVPSEVLQGWFYIPGRVGPLDVAMTVVYFFHFLLPLISAFLLWIMRRHLFYRYVMALTLLSLAQFVTAVILPVAPPRFAYLFGTEALNVTDISVMVARQLDLGTITWMYQNVNGNPVAAFPSLHAAYPVLGYLYLRQAWPRGSLLMLGWGAIVIFAIVYLAHHYVIDALGGIVYTLLAFWAVERLITTSRARALVAHWRGRLGRSRSEA